MSKSKLNSYEDIINMPATELVPWLARYSLAIDFDPEDPEAAAAAGRLLGKISNNYSFLASLYSFACIEKRRLSRIGKTTEYQDMIDKTNAIKEIKDAVDMQQKTLSKLLSLHIDLRHELYTGKFIT